MRAAIAEARVGLSEGEYPYGAVLVDGTGNVLAKAHDTVFRDGDFSSHAETMLVKGACRDLGRPSLAGLTLYTTTEPCPMCFTTAWLAQVDRVVFGTSMIEVRDLTGGLVEEVLVTPQQLNALNSNRSMPVTGGVLRDECITLWDDVSRPDK